MALMLLGSCTEQPARQASQTPQPNGYLALGERSAQYWGLSAGEHYAELARADLPSVVATSVDQAVAGYGDDPSCTRYFHAQALFLVMTSTSCGNASAGAATPVQFEVAAFDSAGGAVHVGVSNSWDTAMAIASGQAP